LKKLFLTDNPNSGATLKYTAKRMGKSMLVVFGKFVTVMLIVMNTPKILHTFVRTNRIKIIQTHSTPPFVNLVMAASSMYPIKVPTAAIQNP